MGVPEGEGWLPNIKSDALQRSYLREFDRLKFAETESTECCRDLLRLTLPPSDAVSDRQDPTNPAQPELLCQAPVLVVRM